MTHDERMHQLLYSNEGRVEQCERIVALEELCRRALVVIENNCSQCAYFYECDILNDCNCVAPMHIRNELHDLGIEVSDA